ncbi:MULTISPECIES: FecR family protein [unclassified Carboxylicivirga]|uniref:FecR family protein n=1 Tax=Carboxylicivirga TaxID=1628153 RepID=UPI003D342F36
MKKIIKVVTGKAFVGREQFLVELRQSEQDKAVYKRAKIAWSFLASSRQAPAYKVEQSYEALNHRIKLSKSSIKQIFLFKYAAVLVLALGIALAMFWLGQYTQRNAEWTQLHTSVEAAYGQIAKIVLPDSSVVWLNSGTKLTYSKNFAVSSRHLELEGQAFFQVSKNEDIPLTVFTKSGINVKVLGTKFDVSAYSDDEIVRVFLEEGAVELKKSDVQNFSHLMNPGEMMTYDAKLKSMRVTKIAQKDYAAWKDGGLIFKEVPMLDVIKRLERKFDVEIEVENNNVYKSIFNAKFRNESLVEILDFIQFSCPITYQLVTEENEKTKVILK